MKHRVIAKCCWHLKGQAILPIAKSLSCLLVQNVVGL